MKLHMYWTLEVDGVYGLWWILCASETRAGSKESNKLM